MVLFSLKSGILRMWQNKRMVLLFFLLNFFLGLILMLPFRAVLSNFVDSSLMGAKLGGHLDMDFLFEFLKNRPSAISTVVRLFPVVFLLYGLTNLFLSGGAFAVFAGEQNYRAVSFWGAAAGYFGRFFRLVLWSIPVFLLLFCLQFLVPLVQRIFWGSDPFQSVIFWGNWTKVGLRFLSIFLFFLIFDYSRIWVIVTNEKKMRYALWNGIRFVASNLLPAILLAVLLSLIGIVILVIYNLVADQLDTPHTLILLLLFLVQQGYIWFRMMLRVSSYASQTSLFLHLRGSAPALSPASLVNQESLE